MKYYIIAGEASGDLHASNLIRMLKKKDADANFRCWGGDLMKAEGAVLVKHYQDLAFMGFLEVVSHLKTISENLRFCKKDIIDFQPDVVILVDYPGFNLRIANFSKNAGFKVVYYISPQLWAWNASRVKKIKKYVDRMLVILPFEEEFYLKYDYKAVFVGHPLLDILNDKTSFTNKETFLRRNNLQEKPIVALLPGSRKQEISKMLKIMLSVSKRFPEHQFVVAMAPSLPEEFYNEILRGTGVGFVKDQTYDLLNLSDAALVTSGTATLETALLNVPQVVCYKGNYFSYLLAKQVVKVKFISLVNLIMNKMTIKELIQDELNTENIVNELKSIIFDERVRHNILLDYALLKERLGGKGASEKAAENIYSLINKN